jgi:hypothetical protein
VRFNKSSSPSQSVAPPHRKRSEKLPEHFKTPDLVP